MDEHDDNPTHANENYQKYLANRNYWKIIKRISRGSNLTSEEEALRNIYSGLYSVKFRISGKPRSTLAFLKAGGVKKILDKFGNEVWLKDADAEDLEKFCLSKFSEFGWELPEDYNNRE